jgi:hypothetical protein
MSPLVFSMNVPDQEVLVVNTKLVMVDTIDGVSDASSGVTTKWTEVAPVVMEGVPRH